MADVEIFATGDEIGTYSSVSVSGKSNGTKVTLNGVTALGSATDVFRIVIRDVEPGDTLFADNQVVDIYAYPDTVPASPPVYSIIVDSSAYNGRASSGEHLISDGIIIDVNGITEGTTRYGPGQDPPLDAELSFESFSEDPPVFPCFAAGTLVETDTGPLPIEVLKPGDLVCTVDNGLQPVRWIGQRRVPGHGDMTPILFQAGALGNFRDLLVSPQHRMLVRDWRAEMHFGQSEVLIAAKHLVNGTTIRPAPMARVTYVHLAFDRHEVILAEGVPSESLHLGSMAMLSLPDEARDEILSLFPNLQGQGQTMETARPCLKSWEARLVA